MSGFNDVERDKVKIVPAIMAVMKRHDEELAGKDVKGLKVEANQLIVEFKDGTELPPVDLSVYLDDTNLARLTEGVLDATTGIATFKRDDDTEFTLDLSSLLTADNLYTADGTITEKRTVKKGANELVFEGNAYSTVTSKTNAKAGGVFKVEGNEGNSQFYQNGKSWFIWNSVANKDILAYSPEPDKLRVKSNIRFDKQVFDETNVPGVTGQVLTATDTGVAWADKQEGSVTAYDLGSGMDNGELEDGKLNPTRWSNVIEAKDLPDDGKIPNGFNTLSSYNGSWKSTVTLPDVGNFVGEMFIINNTATTTVVVTIENTTLSEEFEVKGSGALTAVWSGAVWDVLSNPTVVTQSNYT